MLRSFSKVKKLKPDGPDVVGWCLPLPPKKQEPSGGPVLAACGGPSVLLIFSTMLLFPKSRVTPSDRSTKVDRCSNPTSIAAHYHIVSFC